MMINPRIKNARLGFFELREDMIFDEAKIVLSIMSKMRVIRAECVLGRIHYLAISEYFDTVLPGQEIPHYQIFMKNGQIDYAARQKEFPENVWAVYEGKISGIFKNEYFAQKHREAINANKIGRFELNPPGPKWEEEDD